MKKRSVVILVLVAALVSAVGAYAATDYLWLYSSWVSSEAAQSALNFTAPVKLSDEELSIFRLGYACGYDTAKSMNGLAITPDSGSSEFVATRAIITYDNADEESAEVYIINTETNKFHTPGCYAEKKILPEHRKEIHASFEEVRQMGYSPCGICLR